MYETKTFPNIELTINSDTKEIFSSISSLSKCIGLSESTVRTRINKRKERSTCFKPKGLLYGKRLVPLDLILSLLAEFKPERLNDFVQIVYSLTGVIPKLPELSEVLKTKELEEYYFKIKKEQPVGLIYVMESQFQIIKVGFTTNIESRLKALSRWEGELRVLLTVESSIELEQKFHKALKDTGEVFGYEWYPYSRKEEILELVQNYKVLS